MATKVRRVFTLDDDVADWFDDYSKRTLVPKSALVNALLSGVMLSERGSNERDVGAEAIKRLADGLVKNS
jgi:hypothetical protein